MKRLPDSSTNFRFPLVFSRGAIAFGVLGFAAACGSDDASTSNAEGDTVAGSPAETAAGGGSLAGSSPVGDGAAGTATDMSSAGATNNAAGAGASAGASSAGASTDSASAGMDSGDAVDPNEVVDATENTADDDSRFTVNVALSSAIATVGIVDWEFDGAITKAWIEYGRTEGAVEFTAPVDDASAASHHTLLLGMKQDQTYYGQVVVESDGMTYASAPFSLETGFLPNALPAISITQDLKPEAVFGGFTIACTGLGGGGPTAMGGGGSGSYAFIFDRDAEMVWAYELTDTDVAGCSRARMSYDGAHLWVGNFSNVSPDGMLMRMTLDGETPPEYYSFPGRHHDFTVLPNNHILFYEQANGGGYGDGGGGGGLAGGGGGGEGPDIISELDPETGEATQLYHQDTHFSVQIAESGAHTNHIVYVPTHNAIAWSMRHTNTIAMFSYPDMTPMAVFGGPENPDVADVRFDMSWSVQHGFEILEDRILIFNNNGSNGGSDILEYQFDLSTKQATSLSNYAEPVSSGAFGDVKELPNGNRFITYSTSGVFREISSSLELLREIQTDSIGYSEHRKTLYGPPPPFDK